MPSYCCFSSDFLQSHCTVLLSSFRLPFSCTSWWVHFLIFLRFSKFESSFLQFSPFVAQIKNFCSDPGFFPLTMFVKDLTGCFNHCCSEGGNHWIHVCILLMMVRGVNFPPIIAWKDSRTLGSFSFSRSNLNLVCVWLADSFSDEGGRSSSASRGHF